MELFGHLTFVLAGKLCCIVRITKLNLCLAFGGFLVFRRDSSLEVLYTSAKWTETLSHIKISFFLYQIENFLMTWGNLSTVSPCRMMPTAY